MQYSSAGLTNELCMIASSFELIKANLRGAKTMPLHTRFSCSIMSLPHLGAQRDVRGAIFGASGHATRLYVAVVSPSCWLVVQYSNVSYMGLMFGGVLAA